MTSEFKERLRQFLSDVYTTTHYVCDINGDLYCAFCSEYQHNATSSITHKDNCITQSVFKLIIELEDQD